MQKTILQKTCALVFALEIMVLGMNLKTAEAAVGQHAAGLSLGQVILLGDFSTHFSDSLGFQITHQYDASDLFGVLTHISLSSHSDTTGTDDLSIKGITPNLKANLAYFDKIIVYTYGGFGLFSISEKTGGRESSVTTIGFDLGGGFDLELNEHFLFGTTLSFHNLFGKTDKATAVSVGGTYVALFLNVKYVF